jgi:hypothetical protein
LNDRYPLVSALVLFFEDSKENSFAVEKLRRKFNLFEKAIFHFALHGRFDEETFHSHFITQKSHKRGNMEQWIQFLSRGTQNIILISTFRRLAVFPFLDMVFKKREEEHIMLLSLNEEDKQGSDTFS